jgi:putative ABC transport system permease protein
MGALAPTVTRADAEAETAAIMRRLAEDYPESNKSMAAEVLPFWRAGRGPQGMLLQGLAVLQGVMLVLLLAVCGNTANLLLARASSRAREVGVRLAVGAGRWRIARLLLTESMLLGTASALVGIVVAYWGTNALRAVPVLTTQFPVRFQTDLDGQTLAFAVALGMLAAILFGTAPALQLARVSPQSVMRAGAGLTARGGVRTAIMAVEVALAAIVLVVAALFFKGFQQTRDIDPGFRPSGVLLASYELPREGVSRDEARQFADRVLSRLRALPDVESAALATSIPLDIHGLPSRTFALEGRPRVDGTQERALSNLVTPGYFTTLAIAFVEGRDFVDLADGTTAPEAIVNQEFVRRYVGDGQTLGRRVTIAEVDYVIVGVVRTSLNDSFTESPTPVIYLSYRDRASTFAEMHVRTRLGDELMAAPAVREVIRDLNAALPVFNVRTLTQHVEMNLALRRIPAQMFMVLGPLMLVLAATGIYAVVAYNVAHRTPEIGVRMALGADRRAVIRQILFENMRVVAGGAVIGWVVVAYFYTRIMRGTFELAAFAGVPVVLLFVAAVACLVPARRASRIDPVVALRSE